MEKEDDLRNLIEKARRRLLNEIGKAVTGTVAVAYLAGPIDKTHMLRAKGWRNYITEELRGLKIGVINPLNKYGEDLPRIRKNLQRWKREGGMHNIIQIRKLVRSLIIPLDIQSVLNSDFIIAWIPQLGEDVKEICGSYGESTIAFWYKIPVYVVTNRSLEPVDLSNWLIGCSSDPLIFTSWDELLHFLKLKYWGDKNGTEKDNS